MTPMSKLLKQKPSLVRRALEHTGDMNEAHLLVHNVMVRAIGRPNDAEPDLDLALTRALDNMPAAT